MRVLLLALSMLVGVAGLSGSQAMASTLTVNSTADNTTCDSFLSLREAILMGQGSFTRALTAGEAAQISGSSDLAAFVPE